MGDALSEVGGAIVKDVEVVRLCCLSFLLPLVNFRRRAGD